VRALAVEACGWPVFSCVWLGRIGACGERGEHDERQHGASHVRTLTCAFPGDARGGGSPSPCRPRSPGGGSRYEEQRAEETNGTVWPLGDGARIVAGYDLSELRSRAPGVLPAQQALLRCPLPPASVRAASALGRARARARRADRRRGDARAGERAYRRRGAARRPDRGRGRAGNVASCGVAARAGPSGTMGAGASTPASRARAGRARPERPVLRDRPARSEAPPPTAHRPATRATLINKPAA
jgi:hypothetical protein